MLFSWQSIKSQSDFVGLRHLSPLNECVDSVSLYDNKPGMMILISREHNICGQELF